VAGAPQGFSYTAVVTVINRNNLETETRRDRCSGIDIVSRGEYNITQIYYRGKVQM
jgi:hypothetical protein